MNYNGKKFKVVSNTSNGETSEETIFEYKQDGNILSSNYSGGEIKLGHLLGIVSDNGEINIRYHQINTKNELMTGECASTPELLENGKIRLHEKWKWTSGNKTSGESIIEEI